MLVGFRHPHERQFFEQLLEVEGIGPNRAAAALVFPPAVIARAIEKEDLALLQRLPGVGPRGAQKMVATLRGKVGATALLHEEAAPARKGPAGLDVRSEAVGVLVNLGFRQAEAADKVDDAIRRMPDIEGDVQALIREIFRAETVHAESSSGEPPLPSPVRRGQG